MCAHPWRLKAPSLASSSANGLCIRRMPKCDEDKVHATQLIIDELQNNFTLYTLEPESWLASQNLFLIGCLLQLSHCMRMLCPAQLGANSLGRLRGLLPSSWIQFEACAGLTDVWPGAWRQALWALHSLDCSVSYCTLQLCLSHLQRKALC